MIIVEVPSCCLGLLGGHSVQAGSGRFSWQGVHRNSLAGLEVGDIHDVEDEDCSDDHAWSVFRLTTLGAAEDDEGGVMK